MAIYATYLTNKYGFKLKKVKTAKEKKALQKKVLKFQFINLI